MTELFLGVVNKSISASWLVLAVLLLRLLLRRAPKWVNVLLWGIVAVRLICPVSIESSFSLVPSAETVSPEIMMDWTPEIDTGVPVIDRVVNPVITDTFAPEPAVSANPLQILIPVWSWIWLAGTAVLLLYTLVSYWLLRRKVAAAVRLRYNIYQSEHVTTPFVLGIIHPRVYLPYTMSQENIVYVLSHEKAHIKRRDHWWKPLGFGLLTIHWFNPLMWLAYKLFCRDIELACDAYVIRKLDNEHRADYAQALLACSQKPRLVAACPIAFGEVGVKTRIQSVMNYRKPTFWVMLIAVILCIAVSVCFLTDPKQEEVMQEQPGETVSTVAATENTQVPTEEGMEEVQDLAYFMELANPKKTFRDMDGERREEILAEYGTLLDGYSLLARETTDGTLSYIVGFFPGDMENNPFREMTGYLEYSETEQVSMLYRLEDAEAVEEARAAGRIPEVGYILRESYLHYSVKSGYIYIQPFENHTRTGDRVVVRPNDAGWGLTDVYNKYYSSNGRAYMLDAVSRGIALVQPEGSYLEVSLISEKWGEINEKIPLTESEVAQILSESREKLDPGYGFFAVLSLGAYSSFHVEEDQLWFTEFRGITQTVLDLAVEKCGYKFVSPQEIRSDIVEAKLEGGNGWLEEAVYAKEEDLPRLQEILKNAEFSYVGACGYGAKLTITMADGSELVAFKGTDSCDSMVFGSYGGYSIGDENNIEFWEMFGIDVENR